MLRTINRLIPQFYEGELKGVCKVDGHDIESLSIGEIGRIATSVFQDPRSQFFTMNSCTELAFALENIGVSRSDITQRIDQAFSLFSLERLKDRNVFELSSGERQLIAILCMWVMDTDICLLDEPTANLDYNAINELSKALLVLKKQGKTIVINEHRLYYLSEIADEYWRMEKGAIKQKFDAKEMSSLDVEYLNELGLRSNSLEKLVFQPIPCEGTEHKKIVVENISYRYKKENSNILNQFSFSSKIGEVVAVIGGNGCGKTTLGKILTGLIKPQSGKIIFDDKRLSRKELVQESIFIMQETEFQFFTNSVYHELTYGKEKNEMFDLELERMLKKFDMLHLKDRHPFSLSGGQMQKLSLLIAYFSQKPIVVLDEPTAGLDYNSLKNCVELISEMRKTKVVFVITHDLEFISKCANKAIFLQNGQNQKEFQIQCESDYLELQEYMQNNLKDNRSKRPKKHTRLIDPRIKLLILINVVAAEAVASPLYLITSFIFVISIALYDKRYKMAILWSTFLGVMIGLPLLFPNGITMFLSQLLPRFILLGVSITVATVNDGASKLIAALRKMRLHEKLIMIASVILRFFPVLTTDLKIMVQAIKTRSILKSNLDKLKNIPFLLEIFIVPLTFRVIKIAEVLSASAQTRGIDLKCKRTSFVEIKFKTADYIFMIWFIVLLVVNFIL